MSKATLIHQPCPKCPSSDAYCEYDDGHGYCYSCQYYKHPRGDQLQDYTYEYLSHRGISKATYTFYNCLTKIDAEGKPISVGYKYPNGDTKVRLLEKKEFWWHDQRRERQGSVDPESSRSRQGLYGRDKFTAGASKTITITEGEEDAHSLYQVMGTPTVSVSSSSSALRDISADRSWVDSYERIYLAFDADTAGRTALKAVAKLFDLNKILVVNFDRRKDANEVLQEDGPEALRQLWMSARRYCPENIIEVRLDNIEEILGEKPAVGVSYPFVTLNSMTKGIRRGESVLITALEGVGKTELMHAIEHQLLKETDDGVGTIFLEEDKADHLRILAGLELQKPATLETGCTKDDIKAAAYRVIKKDGRLHIYNHYGTDDPDVLLDTIRFMVAGLGVVYVFLDHIGLGISGQRDESDERRSLDYLSSRLAMMIKELNFALIFVSHVNDFGQTRGSRLIAKDCHVRIDLTRDVKALDERTKNTTHLMVSKNRPAKKTGYAGSLLYDQYTGLYTEISNDNEQQLGPASTSFSKAA